MSPQSFVIAAVLGVLSVPALSSRLRVHDASFSPDYILHVTYEPASVACRSKPLALVNGTSTGPPLYLQENKTTWIRVYNDMDNQNLTVHWHGLSDATAPFSDGTPQASQWPIKATHFFDYEIRPSIGEAGTYFYHSHVLFQAVSVAGPLIVEEASGSPPYEYDEEKMFFISEFFNKTDEAIVEGLTAPTFKWSGEAETLMVNGQSYPGLDGKQSETPKPWYISPSNDALSCGPEIFEVEPGKTYRFRIVAGMALSPMAVAFEEHDNLTIIAADARYTKPADTDRIQMGAGQRFDFLLKTKRDEELKQLGKSVLWIQLETRYRPINVTSYAVLKYASADSGNQTVPALSPAKQPLVITNDIQDWLEYTLEPLQPNNFPSAGQVTRTVYLRSDQLIPQGTKTAFWSVNNRTWGEGNEHLGDTRYNDTVPNVGTPYLVNIYEKGKAAVPDYELAVDQYGGWDPKLNVYPAKMGEIIDIVLLNEPNGFSGGFDVHPWHIHGGHVYDLGSGPGHYDAAANEQKLNGYHPVLRDSMMLYKYNPSDDVGTKSSYTAHGWRAWRLRVQDAGVWMVHCHILQHMIMGMQTVWVMGDASEITTYTEPYVKGYLRFGGSAYGNASYDPLVYHYFDE